VGVETSVNPKLILAGRTKSPPKRKFERRRRKIEEKKGRVICNSQKVKETVSLQGKPFPVPPGGRGPWGGLCFG